MLDMLVPQCLRGRALQKEDQAGDGDEQDVAADQAPQEAGVARRWVEQLGQEDDDGDLGEGEGQRAHSQADQGEHRHDLDLGPRERVAVAGAAGGDGGGDEGDGQCY